MFLAVTRQSRTFQLLMPASAPGHTGSQEGAQPAQLTPAAQSDIPYHMTSCSVYKAGGRRKWGTFRVMAFVFPSNRYM